MSHRAKSHEEFIARAIKRFATRPIINQASGIPLRRLQENCEKHRPKGKPLFWKLPPEVQKQAHILLSRYVKAHGGRSRIPNWRYAGLVNAASLHARWPTRPPDNVRKIHHTCALRAALRRELMDPNPKKPVIPVNKRVKYLPLI